MLPLFRNLTLFTLLALPLSAAEAPKPVTTGNPAIPVEDLALLLTPLTKAELAVEAEAWRDLLKADVQALSEAQISTHQKNREIDAATDAKKTAEAEANTETGATPVDAAGKAADKTAEKEAEKDSILKNLTELQDKKTATLERFGAVLSAYENKGGDPSEYRTYAKAVSGIKVEMNDLKSSWAAVNGWMKSKEGGVKWALAALEFFVIMLVFWVIAAVASRILKRATDRHLNWPKLLERFIVKLTRRAILFLGLLVALSSIGINIGALFALLGGGAFIIGFALQDTLGNFAAGLMLLIYRPFDVGDVVEIGGISGSVDHVSLVSTRIKTFDNKLVLVPNKNVWGQVITNASASSERRVDMVFGIGYDDDISKAEEILEKIVADHKLVLETPAPTIKVHELADSSVNFICRPWSKTPDYWDVYWEITRKVKEEFDAAGISIPYPQQDVHIHQTSPKS